MRVFRRILTVIMIFVICACLCGCSGYSSGYKAVGFVHSNTSDSAFMSFYQFDGRMVMRLRCKEAEGCDLIYGGKLESGSLTVYIDIGEGKEELFSLESGDEIADPFSIRIEGKGKIYIIVETDGKCENGSLEFNLQ